MATGGENSVKSKGSSISTRSATGKGKPIDYKQMASGNYREPARLNEYIYIRATASPIPDCMMIPKAPP